MQSTKRSLIELISNLELGLGGGEDGDSDGFGNLSDREDSFLLEGGGGAGGLDGARTAASSMMAFGSGM